MTADMCSSTKLINVITFEDTLAANTANVLACISELYNERKSTGN